ncbi:hypothetical protein GF339_19295 [candidate division KSB3 bacterium]|jgi:regulator of protease activity HflC (stomatin/prohibitin superfamily)|uniref:Band 7 domain-containing protein n=1 Tax=candidate division KSB3 bacterium TaxID=2044937 RepID=A0A9D5JYV1_9BACT|nr:hypothetical protein [candidate division KSB3 bacterium]MBD3326738.1 hypothetical protein [candidate division KSB3 bacterium]
MTGLLIAIIVVAVIFVAALIYLIIHTPIFTVKEQQAVIIERLGKFSRVYGPGIHFMWPFIEQKRKFMENREERDFVDQRERSVDLPEQIVITKDNVQLQVDSMAYYQISDPAKSVYGVDDVVIAVNQLIKTVLRDVIGATTLQELVSGREQINERLRIQVENASGDWGISIRSVELQAVTPPPTYADAMRRVSEAELAKKAAITEAEGKKEAAILEADGEAEKINRIYKAIHEGNPNEELLKIKYLEALEKIADGNATKVFMPFPSNPTGDNFFQQAFGMAAGFDAYSSPPHSPSKPKDDDTQKAKEAAAQQQTVPIAGEESPKPTDASSPRVVRRKVVRRVPKRPSEDTPERPKT